jgi:hypothetical protein
MSLGRWSWLALLVAAGSSCSLATSKSGAACQRSTQCEPGLGCVQGKCSKDLSAIAATNTVPMLGGGMGGAAAGTGGMSGAAGTTGGASQAGVGGGNAVAGAAGQ